MSIRSADCHRFHRLRLVTAMHRRLDLLTSYGELGCIENYDNTGSAHLNPLLLSRVVQVLSIVEKELRSG